MTMKELGDLLNHIRMDHSFCRALDGLRHVKYIDPHIDSRTWHCFSIKFRGGSTDEVVLHTQNECRDLPLSLYERCMKWLDGEDGVNAYRSSDFGPKTIAVAARTETKVESPKGGDSIQGEQQ